MAKNLLERIKEDNPTLLTTALLLALTAWWLQLFVGNFENQTANLVFGAIYGTTMTLFGGIGGLIGARLWGGTSSLIGKAMTVLSLGLLAQFFGQVVFSYYNIVLQIEIPYPSLADIGYFALGIPLYIYGIILVAKASGISLSLKSGKSILAAIFIPVLMLAISYILFLKNYGFDMSDPLTLVLNYGYPIGQAIYVSLAILTYSLSQKSLGGIMRPKIILVLIAYIIQYAADSNFLWQSQNNTWVNGSYGDFLYLLAYYFMTISLFQLSATIKEIRKK